ncbi:metallophosphoesterase [Cohnella sp. CFH 77786]|uniref:metallophosphoesterase n=1 Tax=Cohnella sp. CFH 77786 TaxID=2662265 RepID=UPI001C60AEF4|nr:metallophosphoesterase [Cohnella sp. CFH 77786]MBW5448041.1 metallophosphoesterase [Cohnella sp. CFH 77786]
MSLLLLCIFGAAILLHLLLIVPTQWLKVERIQHPCGLGIRVLQISDLHVERLRVGYGRLQRLILEEQPDYIVLTGDFTMKSRYLSKVRRYAEAICSLGIPVFAVLGNHDYRLPPADLDRLVRILRSAGVKVLINESVETAGIQWIGIDDFTSKKSNVDEAFHQVNPDKASLVLTHTPELVLHMNRKYTYFMAGHLHGKQFNIPFFFRIKNKGKLAAGGVYKGLHLGQNGPFYISAGIGQAGLNARFLIRSEVTLHHL